MLEIIYSKSKGQAMTIFMQLFVMKICGEPERPDDTPIFPKTPKK